MLYKSSLDVVMCVVGRSEDGNELMLHGAVDTLYDALCEIIKYMRLSACVCVRVSHSLSLTPSPSLLTHNRPQLDRKSLLEQYDLLALTIDEVIDRG